MFIARQPIFTTTKGIYGYELLFRDDVHSTKYTGQSSTASISQVLGNLFEQGVEKIVENQNCGISDISELGIHHI